MLVCCLIKSRTTVSFLKMELNVASDFENKVIGKKIVLLKRALKSFIANNSRNITRDG